MRQEPRPVSRHSRVVRTVSWALVAVLSFQDFAHAAPAGLATLPAPDPSRIRFSGSFAKIEEVHRASGRRMLIHIQDAHTNSGAQMNAARAIDELVTRHGVKTVFIEGGTRDDSMSFLRPLAPRGAREKIARKYLLEGELNGAEYLSLGSDLEFRLLGVEDPKLYAAGLKAYASAATARESAVAYLDVIRARAASLKRRLYPADLVAFDDFVVRFDKKEKSFTEYYDVLSAAAEKLGLNLLAFPDFEGLGEVKATEKTIDFDKAAAQQAALARLMPREELSAHVERLKSGAMSPLPFYEAMLGRARAEGVDVSAFPDFLKYVGYLKKFSGLSLDRVLRDAHFIRRTVYQKTLGGNEEAVFLYEIDEYLAALKNLFSLQASREEFDAYSQKQKDIRFSTPVILAFLNRKLYDLGNYADVVPTKTLIDENKNLIEDFYRTTEDRDDVFLKKSLEKMEKDDIQTAILITGGFHTQSLKDKMKEKNVSYAVITPAVTEETNFKRYEKILLSRAGLDAALTEEKGKVQSHVIPEAAAEFAPVVRRVRVDLESVSAPVHATAAARLAQRRTENLSDWTVQYEVRRSLSDVEALAAELAKNPRKGSFILTPNGSVVERFEIQPGSEVADFLKKPELGLGSGPWSLTYEKKNGELSYALVVRPTDGARLAVDALGLKIDRSHPAARAFLARFDEIFTDLGQPFATAGMQTDGKPDESLANVRLVLGSQDLRLFRALVDRFKASGSKTPVVFSGGRGRGTAGLEELMRQALPGLPADGHLARELGVADASEADLISALFQDLGVGPGSALDVPFTLERKSNSTYQNLEFVVKMIREGGIVPAGQKPRIAIYVTEPQVARTVSAMILRMRTEGLDWEFAVLPAYEVRAERLDDRTLLDFSYRILGVPAEYFAGRTFADPAAMQANLDNDETLRIVRHVNAGSAKYPPNTVLPEADPAHRGGRFTHRGGSVAYDFGPDEVRPVRETLFLELLEHATSSTARIARIGDMAASLTGVPDLEARYRIPHFNASSHLEGGPDARLQDHLQAMTDALDRVIGGSALPDDQFGDIYALIRDVAALHREDLEAAILTHDLGKFETAKMGLTGWSFPDHEVRSRALLDSGDVRYRGRPLSELVLFAALYHGAIWKNRSAAAEQVPGFLSGMRAAFRGTDSEFDEAVRFLAAFSALDALGSVRQPGNSEVLSAVRRFLENYQTYRKEDSGARLAGTARIPVFPFQRMAFTSIPLRSLSSVADEGIGDPEVLVDFLGVLGDLGLHWEDLPINPTSPQDASPFSSTGAFGADTIHIAVRGELVGTPADSAANRSYRAAKVDGTLAHLRDTESIRMEEVRAFKSKVLRQEFDRLYAAGFFRDADGAGFREFVGKHSYWILDHAVFNARQEMDGWQTHWEGWSGRHGRGWTDEGLKAHRAGDVAAFAAENEKEILFQQWLQYVLVGKQWKKVRSAAEASKTLLKGDVPIYVGRNSVDVWAHQALFNLKEEGGAPPDAFSPLAQGWGNPTYNWDAMKADGYRWWVERFKFLFEMYDVLRIDHFRGLEAFWAVPQGSQFYERIRTRVAGNEDAYRPDAGSVTAALTHLSGVAGQTFAAAGDAQAHFAPLVAVLQKGYMARIGWAPGYSVSYSEVAKAYRLARVDLTGASEASSEADLRKKVAELLAQFHNEGKRSETMDALAVLSLSKDPLPGAVFDELDQAWNRKFGFYLSEHQRRWEGVLLFHANLFGLARHADAEWKKAPGSELLNRLNREVYQPGLYGVVGENLGKIDTDVEALRRESGVAGMAVEQFGWALGDTADRPGTIHDPVHSVLSLADPNNQRVTTLHDLAGMIRLVEDAVAKTRTGEARPESVRTGLYLFFKDHLDYLHGFGQSLDVTDARLSELVGTMMEDSSSPEVVLKAIMEAMNIVNEAVLISPAAYTSFFFPDLVGVSARINTPGTVGVHNWRLYLRTKVEALKAWRSDPALRPVFELLKKNIAKYGRNIAEPWARGERPAIKAFIPKQGSSISYEAGQTVTVSATVLPAASGELPAVQVLTDMPGEDGRPIARRAIRMEKIKELPNGTVLYQARFAATVPGSYYLEAEVNDHGVWGGTYRSEATLRVTGARLASVVSDVKQGRDILRLTDASGASIEVAPVIGAKIVSYKLGGKELLYQHPQDLAWGGGIQIMWPFANRWRKFTDPSGETVDLTGAESMDSVAGVPIHGMGMHLPWRVEGQGTVADGGVFARLSLDGAEHPAIGKYFGKVKITVTYTLRDGRLTADSRIENNDAKPRMVSFGFHPWWSTPNKADWEFTSAASAHWETKDNLPLTQKPVSVHGTKFDFRSPVQVSGIDADEVLTGLSYDAGFSSATLHNKADGTVITVMGDRFFPHQVIWTGEKNATAVELQSAATDAPALLAAGVVEATPTVLQPGQSVEGVFKVEARRSALTTVSMPEQLDSVDWLQAAVDELTELIRSMRFAAFLGSTREELADQRQIYLNRLAALRAAQSGARLAGPANGPFSGVEVYIKIAERVAAQTAIRHVAFGGVVIPAADIRARAEGRDRAEFILSKMTIDPQKEYKFMISDLPRLGRTLSVLDAKPAEKKKTGGARLSGFSVERKGGKGLVVRFDVGDRSYRLETEELDEDTIPSIFVFETQNGYDEVLGQVSMSSGLPGTVFGGRVRVDKLRPYDGLIRGLIEAIEEARFEGENGRLAGILLKELTYLRTRLDTPVFPIEGTVDVTPYRSKVRVRGEVVSIFVAPLKLSPRAERELDEIFDYERSERDAAGYYLVGNSDGPQWVMLSGVEGSRWSRMLFAPDYDGKWSGGEWSPRFQTDAPDHLFQAYTEWIEKVDRHPVGRTGFYGTREIVLKPQASGAEYSLSIEPVSPGFRRPHTAIDKAEDDDVAAPAEFALGSIQNADLRALVNRRQLLDRQGLGSSGESSQIDASIARLTDPKYLDDMARLLDHPLSGVAIFSARALGAMKDARAVQPLIRAYRTGSSLLRGNILASLESIDDPSAYEFLRELYRADAALRPELAPMLLSLDGRVNLSADFGADYAARLRILSFFTTFTVTKAATDPVLQTPLALEIIAEMIASGNPSFRRHGIELLGDVKNPAVRERAIAMLHAVAAEGKSDDRMDLRSAFRRHGMEPDGARLAVQDDLDAIATSTQAAADEKDRWSATDLAVISRNVLDWLGADDGVVSAAHKQAVRALIAAKDAGKLKGGFLNPDGIQWPGTAGFRGPAEDLAAGKVGPNYIGEVTMRQYADIYRSYLADQIHDGTLPAGSYAIVAGEVRPNTDIYTTLLAQGIAEAGVRVIRHAEPARRPVSTPLTSHAAQFFAKKLGSQPAAVLMNSASHNGLSDTGVKIGDKTGCQLLPEQVAELKPYKKDLSAIRPFKSDAELRAAGMIRDLTSKEYDELLTDYFDATEAALEPDFKAVIKAAVAGGMKFVTTPLNGATAVETERFLTERLGLVKNVDFFVPDGEDVLPMTDRTHPAWTYKDFDPARKGILDKTIAYAESKGVPMVLARDLDGDRLVIAVKIAGAWKLLDGNQNGIVILEDKLAALVAEGKTSEIADFVMMRSHVTSPLLDAIARSNGVKADNIGVVPVGFKYFGSVVKRKLGAWGRTYFGAEESYGLSIGIDPEKDSLSGLVSMLLVAAKAYSAGKTPYEQLMGIYEKYGYTGDITTKFDIQGGNPAERNANKAKTLAALAALKAGDVIGGRFTVEKTDHKFRAPLYSPDELQDGYRFYLNDKATGKEVLLVIRASGTEPVFKYSFFWVVPMKPEPGQTAEDVVRLTDAYLTETGGVGQAIEGFFRQSWSGARLALPADDAALLEQINAAGRETPLTAQQLGILLSSIRGMLPVQPDLGSVRMTLGFQGMSHLFTDVEIEFARDYALARQGQPSALPALSAAVRASAMPVSTQTTQRLIKTAEAVLTRLPALRASGLVATADLEEIEAVLRRIIANPPFYYPAISASETWTFETNQFGRMSVNPAMVALMEDLELESVLFHEAFHFKKSHVEKMRRTDDLFLQLGPNAQHSLRGGQHPNWAALDAELAAYPKGREAAYQMAALMTSIEIEAYGGQFAYMRTALGDRAVTYMRERLAVTRSPGMKNAFVPFIEMIENPVTVDRRMMRLAFGGVAFPLTQIIARAYVAFNQHVPRHERSEETFLNWAFDEVVTPRLGARLSEEILRTNVARLTGTLFMTVVRRVGMTEEGIPVGAAVRPSGEILEDFVPGGGLDDWILSKRSETKETLYPVRIVLRLRDMKLEFESARVRGPVDEALEAQLNAALSRTIDAINQKFSGTGLTLHDGGHSGDTTHDGAKLSAASLEQVIGRLRDRRVLAGVHEIDRLGATPVEKRDRLVEFMGLIDQAGLVPEVKYSVEGLAAVLAFLHAHPDGIVAVGEIENREQALAAAQSGALILVASTLLPSEVAGIRASHPNVLVISGAKDEAETDRAIAAGFGVKIKPGAKPDVLARNLEIIGRKKGAASVIGLAGGVNAGNLPGILAAGDNVFVGRGIDSTTTDDLKVEVGRMKADRDGARLAHSSSRTATEAFLRENRRIAGIQPRMNFTVEQEVELSRELIRRGFVPGLYKIETLRALRADAATRDAVILFNVADDAPEALLLEAAGLADILQGDKRLGEAAIRQARSVNAEISIFKIVSVREGSVRKEAAAVSAEISALGDVNGVVVKPYGVQGATSAPTDVIPVMDSAYLSAIASAHPGLTIVPAGGIREHNAAQVFGEEIRLPQNVAVDVALTATPLEASLEQVRRYGDAIAAAIVSKDGARLAGGGELFSLPGQDLPGEDRLLLYLALSAKAQGRPTALDFYPNSSAISYDALVGVSRIDDDVFRRALNQRLIDAHFLWNHPGSEINTYHFHVWIQAALDAGYLRLAGFTDITAQIYYDKLGQINYEKALFKWGPRVRARFDELSAAPEVAAFMADGARLAGTEPSELMSAIVDADSALTRSIGLLEAAAGRHEPVARLAGSLRAISSHLQRLILVHGAVPGIETSDFFLEDMREVEGLFRAAMDGSKPAIRLLETAQANALVGETGSLMSAESRIEFFVNRHPLAGARLSDTARLLREMARRLVSAHDVKGPQVFDVAAVSGRVLPVARIVARPVRGGVIVEAGILSLPGSFEPEAGLVVSRSLRLDRSLSDPLSVHKSWNGGWTALAAASDTIAAPAFRKLGILATSHMLERSTDAVETLAMVRRLAAARGFAVTLTVDETAGSLSDAARARLEAMEGGVLSIEFSKVDPSRPLVDQVVEEAERRDLAEGRMKLILMKDLKSGADAKAIASAFGPVGADYRGNVIFAGVESAVAAEEADSVYSFGDIAVTLLHEAFGLAVSAPGDYGASVVSVPGVGLVRLFRPMIDKTLAQTLFLAKQADIAA